MPELPEIETTKRIIGPQITGRRIDETVIMRPEVIARPLADQFLQRNDRPDVCWQHRRIFQRRNIHM